MYNIIEIKNGEDLRGKEVYPELNVRNHTVILSHLHKYEHIVTVNTLVPITRNDVKYLIPLVIRHCEITEDYLPPKNIEDFTKNIIHKKLKEIKDKYVIPTNENFDKLKFNNLMFSYGLPIDIYKYV